MKNMKKLDITLTGDDAAKDIPVKENGDTGRQKEKVFLMKLKKL